MALKLTLRPGEKLVINGAVVQNGDRRATMVVQNRASILREKDILKPEDANTPVRRIYFAIMMLYLDERGEKQWMQEFTVRMTEFFNVLSNADAISDCVNIIKQVQSRQYYKALLTCRKLMPFEEERLNYVAP